MKVYHVRGNRRSAVIFAGTAEEAVTQALDQDLVKIWDEPVAVEVPLPKGYRLIYDSLLGSMAQAELPLPVPEPIPAPPHTITRSGTRVYEDWRDNIVVDAEAPPLVWRAGRDLFRANTDVPGRSYLASENSETALLWNLFRTLEKAGRLDIMTRPLGLNDEFEVLYWYRPWHSPEPLPEIGQALQRLEPRKGYQTETTIILKGRRFLAMVQSCLGKPGAHLRPWERTGSVSVPAGYQAPLAELLVENANWEETMRRFYHLLRHVILAAELSKGWGLEPHLLAIVNQLNRQGARSHDEEFAEFQSRLCWSKQQSHLLTWQALLARAEASFEPAVRPLLAHAKRLSYLQDG